MILSLLADSDLFILFEIKSRLYTKQTKKLNMLISKSKTCTLYTKHSAIYSLMSHKWSMKKNPLKSLILS